VQCGVWATVQYTWLKAQGTVVCTMRYLEQQEALQQLQQ
jgi:hypothetical protein